MMIFAVIGILLVVVLALIGLIFVIGSVIDATSR